MVRTNRLRFLVLFVGFCTFSDVVSSDLASTATDPEPVVLDAVKVTPLKKGDYGLSAQAEVGWKFVFTLRINGAHVGSVRRGGPADLAGIRVGDHVLELAHVKLEGISIVGLKSRLPTDVQVGDSVVVTLLAQNETEARDVTLIAVERVEAEGPSRDKSSPRNSQADE